MKKNNVLSMYFIWLVVSFFYAYQYIIRVLPNLLMPEITQKFALTPSQFGQFSGIYYIGYAIMHIPLGIALDRVGPKKILPLCVLLTTIGIFSLVFASHWSFPIVGRLLMGIGSSAAILGVFKIIRVCFKERVFTRMLGISVTIGLLGAIYGGLPIHYLLTLFHWQSVLYFIIGIGLLLSLLMFLVIPTHEKSHEKNYLKHDLMVVFSNPYVLLICILAGLMVGPLEGFADVWATGAIKSIYQVDNHFAAGLPSLIFLGMCFGSPILGYIADKTQKYFLVITMSGLIMAVCFIMLLSGVLPMSLLSIILVIIGIMCAYQIPAIYQASTFVPEKQASLTTAVANMIIMTFGYIFHMVIGNAMHFVWNGQITDNVPLYTPENYRFALAVIPLGLIIGSIGYVIVQYKRSHLLQNAQSL